MHTNGSECHSLVQRLPPGQTVAAIRERLAAVGRARVWERPAAGDAGRVAAAEARRPIGPDSEPVRAVIVTEGDAAAAHLVLVARRDVPECCLSALLETAASGGSPHSLGCAPPDEPPGPAAAPSWGMAAGEAGSVYEQHAQVSATGITQERLRAAAARVLERYGGNDQAPTDGAPALLLHYRAGPGTYLPYLAPRSPVTIACAPAEGVMHIRMSTDDGLIAREIAEEFLRHLIAAIECPDIAEVSRRAIAWQRIDGGPNPLPHSQISIHQVLAGICQEQPERTAVSCGSRSLTYRELDTLARRVAAGLLARGVGRGDRVGVCLTRDEMLIAVLLGVLHAGAAYVPIDPYYPRDRREYLATTAAAKVIVSTPDAFASFPGAEVTTLDELIAAPPPCRELPEVSGDDLAYIIFTSGSSGRPKGVVVPHRNVLALLAATRGEMALGPADVWTMFHSVAFDFSVWEMWGCLLSGGRLVVVPYWTSRTPSDFHELLAAECVTVLSQTPSAFAQLIAEDGRSASRLAVRLVIFGGEPLPTGMLGAWVRRHPLSECRLVNMYGITETTVHVTAKDISPADIVRGARSVGLPLAGWAVCVRDAAGVPMPMGVPGEIYVGGAGTAIGYWARPDLTGERFTTDERTGERWYRSGDLGRIGPSGALDHLGRIDSQVKIRGFRIELDEIRSVLLGAESVAEAAVVLRDDGEGPAVAAYVVPAGPLTVNQVRNHLARVLPDYMMPASISLVPRLALTANGKLDTAISAPAPSRPRPQDGGGTDTAARMLRAWQRIFEEDVSVDDSFFELGGNSLLVVRLCAAMQEHGLPRLKPREIYLNPTIAQLARVADGREHSTEDGPS